LGVSDQSSFGIAAIDVGLEGAMPNIIRNPQIGNETHAQVTLADVQVIDTVMRETVDDGIYEDDQYVEDVEEEL
jgi:hypothetical protein